MALYWFPCVRKFGSGCASVQSAAPASSTLQVGGRQSPPVPAVESNPFLTSKHDDCLNPTRLRRPAVIAFQVNDMTTTRCASAVARAIKAVDLRCEVRVDLDTLTVEIEPARASARQLSDAIKRAGYSPIAA